MKLIDLKIGTRLNAGFGVLILMMLVMASVSVLRLTQVGTINSRIIEKDWVKSEAAHTINATTRANGRRTMELVLATDADQIRAVKAAIETNKKTINDALQTLEQLVYLPEGKALVAQLTQARKAYVASFTQVARLVDEGKREDAIALLHRETLPALDALQAPITALTALQKKIVEDSSAEARDSVAFARLLLVSLAGLGLLCGLALAWFITRSITQPMQQAVEIARTVAAGDLSSAIQVRGKDETAMLLKALRDMNDSLTGIVAEVRSSSDSMATATSQIAAGNLDLSSRTEEQASALQQTAASMQELAGTVKNNYASGQHAHRLAESAAQVAARGGAMVAQVVQTMEAINTSSNRIADIIGVIDSIAFQTNILALNAAVESARAGEQGRGFAVVASEVRSLAGRSAEAAKEIKALIGTSVENVSDGCRQVEQAGSTMDEIVVSVRRVSDLMREITTASDGQSSGIDEINQAMGQMDQVTQQNAALVEESAAAAQSLEHQAQTLLRTVHTFKLRPQHGATALLALAA